MPELPEVEVITHGLNNNIAGSKILSVEVFTPRMVSGTGNKRTLEPSIQHDFVVSVTGKVVQKISRKGKKIYIVFEDGTFIESHLKMTGQFLFFGYQKSDSGAILRPKIPIDSHTHIIFRLDNGVLLYKDVRKFGYVVFNQNHFEKSQSDSKLISLDPFDDLFTFSEFYERMKSIKKPIKSVFLSQSPVSGVGNIYADEICFEARILPTKKCFAITKIEFEKLYNSLLSILTLAISEGGSSISNYRNTLGQRGSFSQFHKVYGKKGEPCPRCGEILLTTKISSRTTVFCQLCQQ